MHDDGSLDFDSLRGLVDWHVASGTAAIVIVGTTGESPTVSVEEHCQLISKAIEFSAGRIPVIAGTGANSTAEAIELSEFARTAGATAHLSVVPYYNKPTQEGLYQHFRKIAETVDLPLILYNVPSRTVADLSTETTLRLAVLPGIVGIKDATGDIGRGAELLRLIRRDVKVDKEFLVYSGNDDSALALCAMGSDGVISVTANVAPAQVAEVYAAALSGDIVRARELNDRLLPLHTKLFVEANPIPAKWVLHRLGRAGPTVRLPLTPLSAHFEALLVQALDEAGVA